VDEATTRPEFFTFRAHLQAALARHDVEAVMGTVHPDIKNTFGDDNGVVAFRRLWRVGEADSRLWSELATVLALGGSFQDEQTFVAPYTFSRWPSHVDAFEHVAIVGRDVRVHAAPQPDAATLGIFSFTILPLARAPREPAPDGWNAVALDGGRVGYVASSLARSPIDYRAIFSSKEGRWQLVTFVAGD
jgi:hypothetical protein